MNLRIGLDLGGTKIEAIALDDRGDALIRRRTDTPTGNYRQTLSSLAALVGTIESELGGRAQVGVGTPGSISPTRGIIRNANSTWLNGRPLQQDLDNILRRRVRLANDADCFALSEATDGAGAGAASVFGVILGTGTGGGIVIGGRLLTGPNAIAGEWGHNPLPWPVPEEWPGPDCYCGKQGCIETFLSGPGLSRDHAAATGERRTPQEIVEQAEAGDSAAQAVLDRYERRLAKSLASVINIIDPEVIVLGGGLSNIRRLYRNIPQLWGDLVFSDAVSTRLVAPIHGDSSGVRGAAWLWPV